MSHVLRLLILAGGVGLLAGLGSAQQPQDRPAEPGQAGSRGGPANAVMVDSIVARMMAFDKNKDGKLTRDEITDPRLLRLFERADANKDGVATREELVAVATQMAAEASANRGRFGGFGPPGFGPPGGGPGRFGPPPRPGQLLPGFLQERLNLSAEQKKQVTELQKDVDARLGKILTEEQRNQLKGMRQRGPGGFGPPGGFPPGPPPRPQ